MSNRQKQTRRRQSERGAALIVAIAIMTILLAVALTFYAVSRQEVDNAVNVRNQVQTGLLVDSALAIAQAELNREFLNNPNATSLDSAPFSLFNGSWAVGKQWALWGGTPLQSGGVPLVNLSAMTEVRFPEDGHIEQLFNGSRTRGWLTIPRFEGSNPYMYGAGVTDLGTGLPAVPFRLNDYDRPPFVTPAFYGPSLTDGGVAQRYPLEWIHTWTDVDNDGDGLNDAIWIPLPQDKYFSGGEFREELGRRQYDDQIDNDLDGIVDNEPEAGEGEMELGVFVYWGGNDGLDNDGDGLVDEGDEAKLFLTAPLPGTRIPLDLNADGVVPDLVPDDDDLGRLKPLYITLPGTIRVQTRSGPVDLTNLDVDVIDNDYDMLINDYQVYAYVGSNSNNTTDYPPFRFRGFRDSGVPNGTGGNIIEPILESGARNDDENRFATARQKSYSEINKNVLVGAINISPRASTVPGYPEIVWATDLNVADIVVTHSGEPVCEIAGRAAITIRDEASKLNLNVAGGHHYNPLSPVMPELIQPGGRLAPLNPAVFRSLGEGASTSEIETRVLPNVGVVESAQLWLQRMGVPGGNPTGWHPSVLAEFASDVIYPGYGRVDDNGNALYSVLNARDDDGDGLIDEGLFLPEISPNADAYLRGAVLTGAQVASAQSELLSKRYPEYYAQLGVFEGVDEPGELQRYNPLPNLEAEGRNPFRLSGASDNVDNDQDGAINERGELGDLQLQDHLQIDDIFGFGVGTIASLRQHVTTFSTDRNTNLLSGSKGVRALNKLNYNFATPQQIAANLIAANGYQSVTAAPISNVSAINSFADGLRQKDVHIRASGGLMWTAAGVPGANFFPADPILRAMQAAVDIVDNRDVGHARSTLTTERQRMASQTPLELSNFDSFPATLGVRERIADSELLPLGVLEDHLHNTLALSRKLEITDDWWTFEAGVVGVNGRPEVRDISYTASGNEAIKINELMVRAVRRVEAEALTPPVSVDASDPMSGVANPAQFDPSPDFGAPASPSILPEFEVARLTVPTLPANEGWQLANGGVLGGTSFIGIEIDGTDSNSVAAGSDIIEFIVSATDGLPAGRYYLTLNTKDALGNATVIPTGQLPTVLAAYNEPILQSAVKYRDTSTVLQPGVTIIEDVAAGIAPSPFQNINNNQIGGQIPGAPAGWVFVDGTRSGAGNVFNYHFDGVDTRQTLSGQETYTITIPEDTSNFELHIAFRLNPNFVAALAAENLSYRVAINALDFSQEPDHEWVELINISDETVDVGNWLLEIGIPDRPSVPSDPFKSVWRVPVGTEIAPRGMLLLAFNKFDTFQGSVPNDHRFADNGIGLADGDSPNTLITGALLSGNLTVPPIADSSASSGFLELNDVTGSVFERRINPATNALTDYVDWDGDGRTALNAARDTDNLAAEASIASTKFLGSLFSSTSGNLPWDRIVQLESIQVGTANPLTATPTPIVLDEIDDLDDVSAIVLKGGFLPNYPEQDGIDNDGDGGYLLFEQINERSQVPGGAYDVGTAGDDGRLDWIDASEVPGVPTQYIPGVLDIDMVDNDFDGFVDERPYSADYFGIGVDSVFYRAALSEGVDEGRGLFGNSAIGRFYGAGSFERGILPLSLFPNRQGWNVAYGTGDVNPPFTVDSIVPSPFGLQHGINTGFDIYGDPTIIPTAIPTAYQGSDNDPPDWKAFVERRWYPGDNVTVTLYAKTKDNQAVVDRVTYREYDVINRTIDDVVVSPYGIGLNTAYPTMWLPDQMGLDFYRSLERKHPLYNGDRFGTENRWQATDGNYDDWSDSLSFFEAELQSVNPTLSATEPLVIRGDSRQDVRPRFIATHASFTNVDAATVARNIQLFGHAVYGSPLRMNSVMRRAENPQDLELIYNGLTDTRQFPNRPGYQGPFDYMRTHEDGVFDGTGDLKNAIRIPGDSTRNTKSLRDQRWNLSRAVIANRQYQNPGDLMRIPHQVYLHDSVASGSPTSPSFLRDMTLLNYHLQGNTGVNDGISVIQDIALHGATLGQDLLDDNVSQDLLTAAINSMSLDSTVLTMGQAEFRPIRPGGVGAAALNWIPNPGGNSVADLIAPAVWAPVFLSGFGSDVDARTDVDRFPNYPSYVDGSNLVQVFGLNYLFNQDYLSNILNFRGVDPYNNVGLDNRWPLETRTAMFVSEKRDGLEAPEGLFTWDGADGLENGEYVLYIGTFMPQMRDALEKAASATAQVGAIPTINVAPKDNPALLYVDSSGSRPTVDYELPGGQRIPVDAVTASLLQRDPTSARTDTNGRNFEPTYAIDVITDPTEARGIAPQSGAVFDPSTKPAGLVHPNDWQPTVQFKAGDDGYIAVGNNNSGTWQPYIVRVTDNFLAIRVRNVGSPGEVGVLSHVVLAPRKRTAGKVNLNTVQSRVHRDGGDSYFSTLLGLPGVVDVARTIQPSNAVERMAAPIPAREAIDLMAAPSPADGSWAAPGGPQGFYPGGNTPPQRNTYRGDLPSPDWDLLVQAPLPLPNPPINSMLGNNDTPEHRLGAFRLNALIMTGRSEHADGRYYRSTGDVVRDDLAFEHDPATGEVNIPVLDAFGPSGVGVLGVENRAVYPISNDANPARRFDEVKSRLSAMGNSITVRSDVFEILITVESGYGIDRNGDGFINYRDKNEFVTTGASKASAVYERRAPSDLSDSGE